MEIWRFLIFFATGYMSMLTQTINICTESEPRPTNGRPDNEAKKSALQINVHANINKSESGNIAVNISNQNGIPMVQGSSSSYYVFSQKGRRQLILSCKPHQSIVIGHDINIEVLEINNDKVKLAIVCPDNTTVFCNDISGHAGSRSLPR
jgi:carbon storage regulator CsrA